MILIALFISLVTLAAAATLYCCFGIQTEENASGPRSSRDPSHGLVEALGDRVIALGNATAEACRATRNAASRLGQDIAARARRLDAWLILRQAEGKAKRAQEAVIDQHLLEAEALLDQALELLECACEELRDARNSDVLIDRVRRSCRSTAVSLGVHAAFTVRKMNHLLAGNDRPVIPFKTNAASGESRRRAA